MNDRFLFQQSFPGKETSRRKVGKNFWDVKGDNIPYYPPSPSRSSWSIFATSLIVIWQIGIKDLYYIFIKTMFSFSKSSSFFLSVTQWFFWYDLDHYYHCIAHVLYRQSLQFLNPRHKHCRKNLCVVLL